MDLRIGLDRRRWIQSAIAYLFAASLSASRLRDLIVVVLKAEEVRHVICRDLLLPRTAHSVLMHHRFALVQVSTHVHALNIDGLRHTVRLIVKVRIIRHIIARLDIDLKELFTFGWRG